MTAELQDARVLGALRFTDVVTSLPIDAPLAVVAPGVRWIRNRRSCWVIAAAPGLDAHLREFSSPPAGPAVGSVSVGFQVSDPAGQWLSRSGAVLLPRDPAAANSAQSQSLFAVADVPLYPTPAARTQRGWSVIRASVAGTTPGTTLAGALVRVVRDSDGVRIGGGMSDARGEALIAVQGIPSSSLGEGDGPVVATEISVRLDVVWDPAAGAAPNPDALEANHAALLIRTATAKLASGRTLTMRL
ncbi:MAG TPA: hypothetical protein VK636_08085 [Gemmatimonadaceae bacterium]|nr:hypothetical protein [Gemmatimonadaceae bacterium]